MEGVPARRAGAPPHPALWGPIPQRRVGRLRGFAGGVAALVRSHFPDLSNDQLRQVLRNTARPAPGVTRDARGWDDRLGHGLLDAHRAVTLSKEQLCRDIRLVEPTIKLISRGGKVVVEAEIENRGAFDSERAIAVVYNGDPARPVAPSATYAKPAGRTTWQLGHSVVPVPGLHRQTITLELTRKADTLWFETFCLDRHDAGKAHHDRWDVPR